MFTRLLALTVFFQTHTSSTATGQCDELLFMYAETPPVNVTLFSECSLPVRVHHTWSELELPSSNASHPELNQLLENYLLLPICDQLRIGYIFCPFKLPYVGILTRGRLLDTALQFQLRGYPPDDHEGFPTVDFTAGRLIVDRNCKRFAGNHIEMRASLSVVAVDPNVTAKFEAFNAHQNHSGKCDCPESTLYDDILTKCTRTLLKSQKPTNLQKSSSRAGTDEFWKRKVVVFVMLCVCVSILAAFSVGKFLSVDNLL